jgi:endonuclease YncB( thermonuclease family)
MLKRYRVLSLGFVISALFLAAMACAQSGQILSAEQATASAAPTAVPTTDAAEAVEGFADGDTVYLTGRYLINMMDAPGSKTMIAAQERGVAVIILSSATVDGVNWYQIDAPTGIGWVPETNLTTEAP